MISGLIVCTILPFVKLKLSQSHALQQTVFQFEELLLPEKLKGPEARYVLPEDEWVERANPEAAVSQHTTGVSIGRPVSPVTALTVIYWLGVGIMLLRLGASFISLYRLLGKSRRIEKDYLENPDEIVLHEKMHIHQKHNIDVFFSELFLAVHWFNPMVWLLCRDLREIHEYEADNAVIEAGIEAQKYHLKISFKIPNSS